MSKGPLMFRDRILQGDPVRTTLWLAWPIILANLVNISYNIIDTFWLGKLGKASLSAPVVSWPLIMFFHAIGMGFSFAGVTFISQYVGAGDSRMARKSAGMLVGFSLLISFIIAGFGVTTAPYILKLMDVPPDVLPKATHYIRIIFAGEPLVYLGFVFSSIVQGLGDTKTPTYIGIVSSALNMILDPLLIFGLGGLPPLGVTGAALATILSRAFMGLMGIYLLHRGFRGIKVGVRDLGLEWWWVKKVVKVGTPMAVQQSANSLGFVVMMSIVSGFGSAVIAAYGIALRIVDLTQSFTWGIMRATAIIVGQNIGAREFKRAEEITNKNVIMLTSLLALGVALIVAFRDPLVAFFINDPSVLAEASKLIMIFAPSIPFFGVFFIGNAVARGSGHTLPVMIISIVRLWVLRIGLSYILAYLTGLGSLGVWIAMCVSNVGAGIAAYAWIRLGDWKKPVVEAEHVKMSVEGSMEAE
ncbi:MAG: MATE family efflux transporter [Desulfurococcales archaeon]|nr:MATE family efflux transporter [Desulfurococcales archaeon]